MWNVILVIIEKNSSTPGTAISYYHQAPAPPNTHISSSSHSSSSSSGQLALCADTLTLAQEDVLVYDRLSQTKNTFNFNNICRTAAQKSTRTHIP